jgi:tetratricopeptide (TPR) repeat protein
MPPRAENPAADGASAHAAGFAIAAAMLAVWSGASAAYGIVKLFAASSALAVAWALLCRSTTPSSASALDKPLGALAAALLLSLAFSPDRWVGLVGVYGLYNHGLVAFALAVSAFLIVGAARDPRTAVRWIVVSGLLAGIWTILQKAGVSAFGPVGRALPHGRAVGPMGDPVFLGAALIAVFPPAAEFCLRGSGALRLLGAATLLAAGGAAVASGSRGAVLSMVAALAVWAALEWRVRDARAPRPVWVAGALLALVLAAGVYTARSQSPSDRGRVLVWKAGVSVFLDAPLFGAGVDRFQTAMRRYRDPEMAGIIGTRGSQVSAHNDWLQMLSTAGAVGGLAWLWLHWGLFVLLRRSWDDLAARALVPVSAGMLAGLFVQAKLNPLPVVSLLHAAVAAGVLAGALGSRLGERVSRVLSLSGTAAAFAAAVLAAGLLRADAALSRARSHAASGRVDAALAAFETAVRRNPYEMHYRVLLSRALYGAASRVDGPSRRRFLERAVAVGDEALYYRPSETEGYLIGATYRLALAASGFESDLAAAADKIDFALDVDPLFQPALENGAHIARALGRTERAEELTARLETLRAEAGRRGP